MFVAGAFCHCKLPHLFSKCTACQLTQSRSKPIPAIFLPQSAQVIGLVGWQKLVKVLLTLWICIPLVCLTCLLLASLDEQRLTH